MLKVRFQYLLIKIWKGLNRICGNQSWTDIFPLNQSGLVARTETLKKVTGLIFVHSVLGLKNNPQSLSTEFQSILIFFHVEQKKWSMYHFTWYFNFVIISSLIKKKSQEKLEISALLTSAYNQLSKTSTKNFRDNSDGL